MTKHNILKAADHLNIIFAGIVHHCEMSAAYRHGLSFFKIVDRGGTLDGNK